MFHDLHLRIERVFSPIIIILFFTVFPIYIFGQADLAITQNGLHNGNDANTSTFVITIRNNGPNAATNVVVTDNLSTDWSFNNPTTNYKVSHGALSWAGTANRNMTWNIPYIPNGGVAILTYNIYRNFQGYLTANNTASIAASDQTDPNTANNSVTTTSSADYNANNLGITTSISNSSPSINSNVTFTVTVTRPDGAGNNPNVYITDKLPSGFTYVSSNTNGTGSYNSTTGVWDLGINSYNIAQNGGTRVLTIVGTVKTPTGATDEYKNVAAITSSGLDINVTDNIAFATATVASPNPPVAVGENTTTAKNFPVTINILANDTYSTLSAINITQQPINGLNITKNGLTNVTYTPNTNFIGSDSFKYTITDNVSTSNEVTVNITVTDTVAPTAVAESVSAISNQPKVINVLANDTPGSGAFNTITIVNNVSHGSTTINPDKTITYTPATNYTGVDSFQYNVTNVHNLTSNTVTVSINVLASTGLVRWSGDNSGFAPTLLASNITSANISSNGGIGLTNQGQYNQYFNASGWPTPAQNGGYLDESKYVQFTVTSNINYKIDLNQFNFEAQLDGGNANYEVRYSKNFNNGYLSSNGTLNGNWESKTINLSNLGTIMPEETLYIRLYLYNSYNPIRIRHSWGGTTGPTITGAISQAITGDPADLAVTNTMDNNTPTTGNNVVFTIVARNYGPNTATGTAVVDQLPAGFSYVSSTASMGSYNSGTGVWTIGSLTNNATATLQITATKLSSGPYTNTATISHNGEDSNPSNNTSSATPTNACANCTNTIISGNGSIVVNSGQVFCLHSGTFTGTVTLNSGGTICVGEGATFSPSWGPNVYEGTIINHGTTNFYTYNTSTYHPHIINHGIFNSTNMQNFAGILENMSGGTVEMLSGDAVFLADSEVINHGSMILNKFNGTNMKFTNYQDLTVNNNFYFLGTTGYFENKSGAVANLNPTNGSTWITSPFDNSGSIKIYNANAGGGISTVVNNYGTMQIYQNIIFGIETYLTNDGTLEFHDAASVEFQGPLLQNNNLLTIYNNGNLSLNSPISQMVNNKKVVVAGSVSHNIAGSKIINNCSILSTNYFVGNGQSENNGLIWVSNNFQLEGTTSILYNSATGFIRGANFRNSGEIRGYGSFYFTGDTNFESDGDFIGDDPTSQIQFFDATPTGPIFDHYVPDHPAINVIRPDSMTPYDDTTYNCSAPPTTAGYPPTTTEVDITQCVPATVSFNLVTDGSPIYVTPHAPVNGNSFTLLLSTIKLFDPSDNNNATNNTTNLTIPGKGTFIANTTTGQITFTPSPSFTSGTAEAQYKISNQWSGNPPIHPSPKTNIIVKIANLPELTVTAGSTTFCTGGSMTFSNTVEEGTWTSSNTSVATVNNGMVTGISSGTSTISYTVVFNSFPPSNTCSLTVSQDITVNNCGGPCYKEPNFTDIGQPTAFGISTVTNHNDNWPYNIPNGFVTLESQNKGFVITRVAHVSSVPDSTHDAIIDPKEGMIVYDIQDKCVKIFNGTNWKCIQKNCDLN